MEHRTKASPVYKSEQFTCPHCGIASHQSWFDKDIASPVMAKFIRDDYLEYRAKVQGYQQEAIWKFIQTFSESIKQKIWQFVPQGFSVATCSSCGRPTLWINKEMVYPKKSTLPPPNIDLSEKVKDLYNEAASILPESPRGATALLRLSLQMLLRDLGKPGKNINDDIKDLVESGLSPRIQQALDLLRVVGKNAVHPGQIDLEDNTDIAVKMFHTLNFIAEELITKPKELDFLYAELIPEATRNHIAKRDLKSDI